MKTLNAHSLQTRGVLMILVAMSLFLAMAAPSEAGKIRVLILGDSISIGYTPHVREILAPDVKVIRPSVNCQYSAYGLDHLDEWLALGDGQWDVIHFNWGIWDTHLLLDGNLVKTEDEPPVHADSTYGYVSDDGAKIRCTPAQYRANLSAIVDELEKTGARLIFATTTPWPSRRAENQFLIDTYNQVATELMKQRGVEINDLNAFVTKSGENWFSDGVHYTDEGYRRLAEQISAHIIPEPATCWLLTSGAAAFLGYVCWRKRRHGLSTTGKA